MAARGCFEWIAWSVIQQVQVHMMFGKHVVDMMQFLVQEKYTSCDRSAHAQMQSASVSLDSLHPCVNHYVAGRPPKMRDAGDKEVRACREDIG